ncbi:MAG: hypothetical protein HY551_07695, partial [Elusimicrobia bacterium]|nr:hypothetical protein [Elusimicrobiota bacterium]
ARRGVPVLRLRRAEWTRHGLRVEVPGRNGFRTMMLREGDELLLDATASSGSGRSPEARLAFETVREPAAPAPAVSSPLGQGEGRTAAPALGDSGRGGQGEGRTAAPVTRGILEPAALPR